MIKSCQSAAFYHFSLRISIKHQHITMKPKILYYLIISVIAITACRREKNNAAETLQQVTVAKVTGIMSQYKYEASIIPANSQILSFDNQGIVGKIYVSKGQMIAKGTLVADILNKSIKNRYDSLKKLYTERQYKLKRDEKLLAINEITQKEYDRTTKEFENISNQYNAIAEQFNTTKILAGFSGVVEKIHIQPGKEVVQGEPVVTLSDSTQYLVSFAVYDQDVKAVLNANNLTVKLESDESIQFKIKVLETQKTANHHTTVTATFDPNQYTQHKDLITNRSKGTVTDLGHDKHLQLLIPQQALITNVKTKKYEVWVVHPKTHKISKRSVICGEKKSDGQIVIHQGLTAKELVVITPSKALKEGQKVKINR